MLLKLGSEDVERGSRMKDMTMLRVEVVGWVHGQLGDNYTCEESRSKASKCPIILIHLIPSLGVA